MPGKRWTRTEKQLLKKQIAGGIPAHNIVIENRTWNGIAYILRALRIFWNNRWTKAQIRSLVRQIIKERKRLPDIYIEGKSPAAVNNQRRRLRLRGKLDIGQALRKRKYSDEELAILEHYGCKLGWTARQICEAGMLPNRSYHSISKAMGRQGYGDPVRVERAKQARRLKREERKNFEQFIRGDGRKLSSERIAELWGIARNTVNFYRRKFGVSLSWHEARAVSSTVEKRQRLNEIRRAHLKRRWTRYRTEQIKRLLSLQQRLKRRGCQARTRVCKSCACEWFALPVFFPTHTDKRKRGARISMSRTCRICKMKLKLEKGDESTMFGEKPRSFV